MTKTFAATICSVLILAWNFCFFGFLMLGGILYPPVWLLFIGPPFLVGWYGHRFRAVALTYVLLYSIIIASMWFAVEASLSMAQVLASMALIILIGCTPVVLLMAGYARFLGRLKRREDAARKQALGLPPGDEIAGDLPDFLVRS